MMNNWKTLRSMEELVNKDLSNFDFYYIDHASKQNIFIIPESKEDLFLSSIFYKIFYREKRVS